MFHFAYIYKLSPFEKLFTSRFSFNCNTMTDKTSNNNDDNKNNDEENVLNKNNKGAILDFVKILNKLIADRSNDQDEQEFENYMEDFVEKQIGKHEYDKFIFGTYVKNFEGLYQEWYDGCSDKPPLRYKLWMQGIFDRVNDEYVINYPPSSLHSISHPPNSPLSIHSATSGRMTPSTPLSIIGAPAAMTTEQFANVLSNAVQKGFESNLSPQQKRKQKKHRPRTKEQKEEKKKNIDINKKLWKRVEEFVYILYIIYFLYCEFA